MNEKGQIKNCGEKDTGMVAEFLLARMIYDLVHGTGQRCVFSDWILCS